MKGKSLKLQVMERLGKNWSKGSLTKRKLHANAKEFAEFLTRMFGLERIDNLKPGHVEAYIQSLRDKGLMHATMADKLTAVRFIAKAIGKQNIVPKHNRDCGVHRVRVNPQIVSSENLESVMDHIGTLANKGDWRAQMTVAARGMRREFGLRAKESLLSHRTIVRDGGTYLIVEGAKGGRPRELLIQTPEQAAAVAKVAEVAGQFGSETGRPIPPGKSLKQAYDAERNLVHRLGGTRERGCNMHAERHQSARAMRAVGASDSEIMEYLGHGSTRPAAAYLGSKRNSR